MAKQQNATIERGWMPYTLAAREYVGIDPSVFLGAMKRKELKGYKKPITKGRTNTDPSKQRDQYFVCPSDVDDYIRTYWEPAFVD